MYNLKKIYSHKTKEDQKADNGKTIKAGTVLTRGASCHKCKTWYPFAVKITACNGCGYKTPTKDIPTPLQIRRRERSLSQQKRIVAEREIQKAG